MALTPEQIKNLNRILEIIKNQKITDPNTGEVKDKFTGGDAYLAAWIANSESGIGINTAGQGTISGIYQYGDGRWEDRFKEYGDSLGFQTKTADGKLNETELERWKSMKDDTDTQTNVFLKDMERFQNEFNMLKNGGAEAEKLLRDPQIAKAWNRMAENGIPQTAENFVYMRHNTNPKEVIKENFDRLLDLSGSYSDVEKAVETAYGQQITDPYANPSLTPLMQKLADAVHLNIEGMTNQEALGWIRERYKRLNRSSVDYLLKCLSGYNKLETSKLWQYWNNTRSLFTTASVTRSPILLDLDGDGVIKTLGTDAGIHFDHDGNGFKELSGWVAQGDGVLMLDRDLDDILDNGSELFGNFTPFANGMLAVNGFQALAQFDSNGDGKIDASDPIWSQLKVWQHDPEATDTGDPDSSGIFKTLDELGIQSINTGYADTNITDANGNTIKQVGSFTKSDGTTGAASDVYFQVDNMNTIANEWVDVPADIAALPDLQGYGNVYDLQQAMAREALSGQQSAVSLKSLVEQFMNETDASVRHDLVIQILYKWAGVENVDPLSRAARIIYGNAIKNHAKTPLSFLTGDRNDGKWYKERKTTIMLRLAA